MMLVNLVLFFIVLVVALRLNSKWERNLKARRKIHGILLPLYHYLGLLDHEIQGEVEEVDNLFRQAVLDHVTELRAFLLQPGSRDLKFFGSFPWVNQLNNLLLAMEDTLESEGVEIDAVELREQVSHLLKFIQANTYLSGLISKPLGSVSYSLDR